MEETFNPVEIRVLGCLIEKQITVPESYPLTLNSLAHACNQTTNRDPVMSLDEGTIEAALETLREKGLVWKVAGGRAQKYEHGFNRKFELGAGAIAAMCVMMLRGPQTAGEIRARAGRLHAFASLEEVNEVLESLMRSEPPFTAKLPRLPGTKEPRFIQLLGGHEGVLRGEGQTSSGVAAPNSGTTAEKLASLDAEVQALRQELESLRQQFLDLKRQFE